MAPDQEADDGNRQTGEGNPLVAEEGLAGEDGQQFADNAQAGQHEDIDRRVGVEPEEMLEENRVAAHRRVKEAHAQCALGHHHQEAEPINWVAVNWIRLVAKTAQQKMGMRKRLMPLGRMGRMVTSRLMEPKNRRKTDRKDAQKEELVADGATGAQGRIGSPAGVPAAEKDAAEQQHRAGHVDPEAKGIEPGEGHILGAEHQGHQVVGHTAHAQQNGGQDHKAVHTDEGVVQVQAQELEASLGQFRAEDQGQCAADHQAGSCP